MSLVDHSRQWFKANIGLGATETPRDVAFCSHAILRDDLFVVPDATADPRFRTNPLGAGAPHTRFYAGTPLALPGGHRVGTLCVINIAPQVLADDRADAPRALGRQVVAHLRLRRHFDEMEPIAAEKQQLAADLLLCDAQCRALTGQGPLSAFE